MKQQTIINDIGAKGFGRDSEQQVRIRLSAAPENTGIVFRVVNAGIRADIAAIVDNVRVTNDRLVLASDGVELSGVEHLLAACYGSNIHNLYVDVEGAELPRMTDSAAGFLFLLRAAGTREQNAQRQQIILTDPLLHKADQGWIRLNKFNGLRVGCVNTLSENASSVHRSSAVVDVSPAVFATELCHAQAYEDMDFSGAEFSQRAEKNLRLLAQRSQLNHMVVKVLSMLALTNCELVGCYTAFDAAPGLHLSLVRQLMQLHVQQVESCGVVRMRAV